MIAPTITAITVAEHPAKTDDRLEHGWLQEYDNENNNSRKYNVRKECIPYCRMQLVNPAWDICFWRQSPQEW